MSIPAKIQNRYILRNGVCLQIYLSIVQRHTDTPPEEINANTCPNCEDPHPAYSVTC